MLLYLESHQFSHLITCKCKIEILSNLSLEQLAGREQNVNQLLMSDSLISVQVDKIDYSCG